MSRPLPLIVLCLIVAGVLYGTAFDNSFREDDFYFLTAAIELPGPAAFLHPQQSIAFFRPAAFALFWMEYLLFGLHGGAYLMFNFLLHLINALLAGLLLRRIGLTPLAAILATGSWLIGVGHYGKQVIWACTSGGLLTVTLTLLALWLSADPRDGGSGERRPPSGGRFGLILFSSILAPLFHESGLIAPLLILGLAASRGGVRSVLKVRFLLVPGLTWSCWYLTTLIHPSASSGTAVVDEMILTPFVRLIGYLGLMILPLQSSSFAVGQSPLIGLAQGAQPLIGIGFLLWAIYLLLFKRRGGTPFLALWLIVAILPFTLVPLPEGWLELRYLYLAAIPMCALLVTGLWGVWNRWGGWGRGAVILVGVIMMIATVSLTAMLERKYDREAATGINAKRMHDVRGLYLDHR